MAFRHNIRRLPVINWTENTQVVLDLPRDRFIKSINLQLDSVVTLAAGSASGAVQEDATVSLISKIEIIANGVITLFRCSGKDLYYRNLLHYGIAGVVANPADGSAAAKTLYANLHIDFQNNIGIVPADTFLPAMNFNTLQLVITFGTMAGMFNATCDRTKTMTSFSLRPVIFETLEPSPQFIRFFDTMDVNVPTTTGDQVIKLNSNVPRIYQEFIFHVKEGAADIVRSNGILNFVNLTTDEAIYNLNMLPNVQWLNYTQMLNGIAKPTGIYQFNLLEDGRIPSGLDVEKINQANFHIDVTAGAASNIRILQDFVVPVNKVL
jgi:hypothetical protein